MGILPSAEPVTLGGMSFARGYRESILLGDTGWFASIEYGFPPSAE